MILYNNQLNIHYYIVITFYKYHKIINQPGSHFTAQKEDTIELAD